MGRDTCLYDHSLMLDTYYKILLPGFTKTIKYEVKSKTLSICMQSDRPLHYTIEGKYKGNQTKIVSCVSSLRGDSPYLSLHTT